jgi:hypothetical protein
LSFGGREGGNKMSEHERIHEQPKGENSRSSVTEMVLYRPNVTLLIAGQIFLFAALMLFGIAGYSLYRIAEMGPSIEVLGDAEGMTTRDIYNFYGRILSVFLSPLTHVQGGMVDRSEFCPAGAP